MEKLSKNKIKWLKENFPKTTNKECCEVLNITPCVLRRLRIKYGLKKNEDYLIEQRRQNAFKAASSSINRNYESQRENLKRLREAGKLTHHNHRSYWNGMSDEKKEEMRKKLSESRKKLIESERKRIRWGFAPITKIKNLNEQNRQRTYAKYSLLKRHGYIFIKKWEFGYNIETKRSIRLEKRYFEKYKFKFTEIKLQEHEEDFDF